MQNKNAITSLIPGAVAVEEIFHQRALTKEEKDTKMQEVLRNLDKVDRISNEIKAFVDEKKSDIKTISMDNVGKRKMLQDGFEGVEKTCFLMPDHQNGVMNYVDAENPEEVLWSRPLFPNERQLYISNAPAKSASN